MSSVTAVLDTASVDHGVDDQEGREREQEGVFPSVLHFAPCFARSAKPGARGSSRWRRSTPPRAAASRAGARGRSAVASARPGSPGRCERAAPGATRCAHAAHELCAPQIAQTSKTPAFKRPRGTPMRFRGGCGAAFGAPFGGGCSGGRQLPADPSASGSGRRAHFGGERSKRYLGAAAHGAHGYSALQTFAWTISEMQACESKSCQTKSK